MREQNPATALTSHNPESTTPSRPASRKVRQNHLILAIHTRAPQAVICYDPFHVINLAGDALDAVRLQGPGKVIGGVL